MLSPFSFFSILPFYCSKMQVFLTTELKEEFLFCQLYCKKVALEIRKAIPFFRGLSRNAIGIQFFIEPLPKISVKNRRKITASAPPFPAGIFTYN